MRRSKDIAADRRQAQKGRFAWRTPASVALRRQVYRPRSYRDPAEIRSGERAVPQAGISIPAEGSAAEPR
jgi:hypothetical protein